MNYIGLAVAQSALLQRIGDPKTRAEDTLFLVTAFEHLLQISDGIACREDAIPLGTPSTPIVPSERSEDATD